MKKMFFIVVLCLGLVSIASQSFCATLDELYRPLLKAKQLRLDGYAKVDYYGSEYDYDRNSSGTLTAEDYDYDFTRYLFGLQGTYGISPELQLSVLAEQTLPFSYNIDKSSTASTGNDSRKEKYDNNYNIFTELKYRPSQAWDVGLSYQHREYDLNADGNNTSYDYSTNSDSRLDRAELDVTWLSNPKAKIPYIKADLDGLHNPLLDKKQLQIGWNLLYYSKDRNNYYLDYVSDPAYEYEVNYLSPGIEVTYGVSDSLQLDVYGNYYFQDDEEKLHYEDYDKTTNYDYSYDYDYADNFEVGAKLTKRIEPNYEFSLETMTSYYKTNGTVDFDPYGHYAAEDPYNFYDRVCDTDIYLSLTYLSKAKKDGVKFDTDLNGLEHPLLEKKQVKMDLTLYINPYRYVYSQSDGTDDDEFRYYYTRYVLETQLTNGLTDKLQSRLALSYDIPYDYAYRYTSLSGTYYDYNVDYNERFRGLAELKYRPDNTLEFLASATYKPVSSGGFLPTYGIANHRSRLDYTSYHRDREFKSDEWLFEVRGTKLF